MAEDHIQSEEFFSLLEKLMNTPTAPFREQKVRDLIVAEVALRPELSMEQDCWGNLLISNSASINPSDLVFCAHMDHPGFVDGRFLGSMRSEYRHSLNRVVEFDNGIGMWDLPPFERGDGFIRGRACDDLIGCAVALAAVFHHARTVSEYKVHALLTVAEEVGLFGAALACVGGIVPKDATVISIETSPALSYHQFHAGCIVRVGDKETIFSPAVTRCLIDAAKAKQIPYKRHLMDGGTCEGSIFFDAGYQTGALCVALGNAHNQGPDGKVEMEYVSEADVIAMARLAIEAPRHLQSPREPTGEIVAKVANTALRELNLLTEKKTKS